MYHVIFYLFCSAVTIAFIFDFDTRIVSNVSRDNKFVRWWRKHIIDEEPKQNY